MVRMNVRGVCAFVLLIGLSVPVMSQQGGVHPEVIYGDDDRLDLYQVEDEKILSLADSTVGLFDSGRVVSDGAGTSALTTRSYASDYSLCSEEPFFSQKTGAFCSGSLVGPDILMTAGHCITSQASCEGTKFVFGFGIKEEGVLPDSVPDGDVYGCGELLGRSVENSGADWALIRLDRPVTGHKPLAINRSGTITVGTPLLVIGHPAGLPTKVAGGASVRSDGSEGHFVANLDTYGGNSGSAVFNARTTKIEGILVRGEVDYKWKGSCRVSNVCADDGCRGEDVTKISAVSAGIPAAQSVAPASAGAIRLSSPGRGFWALLDQAREGLPRGL